MRLSNPWSLSAALSWRYRPAGAISFARRPCVMSTRRLTRLMADVVICATVPIVKNQRRSQPLNQRHHPAAVATNSIGSHRRHQRRFNQITRWRRCLRPSPACLRVSLSSIVWNCPSRFPLPPFTSSIAFGCVNGSVVPRRLRLPPNSVSFQNTFKPIEVNHAYQAVNRLGAGRGVGCRYRRIRRRVHDGQTCCPARANQNRSSRQGNPAVLHFGGLLPGLHRLLR